jgi:hypothetical protein
MLNPDTPTAWLMARLKNHAPLVALLGGPFVFQAGNVDVKKNLFVVVRPPARHGVVVYGKKYPQTMEGRYLIYAETRTDRLPPGKSLDEVLTPVFLEIQQALLGVSTAIAPTGGVVHGCEIVDFYTPPAYTPPNMVDVQVKQKGVACSIINS